jgi:hypothetical protein
MTNVIVVIRSVGERTLPLCRALVLREVAADRVHVIHEQPFEAALRSCYQIGLASSAEWMITVDADVLPREGAIGALLNAAQRAPARVPQVEGMIHDRLIGDWRAAGHRAYRTKFLHLALNAIPADGTTLRPEWSTLDQLDRLGHPSQQCAVLFGMHDYEQFYRDLYRTGFVHGQKHTHWLADVVPAWRNRLSTDDDLRVALRGFSDGLQAPETARIDARAYVDAAARALLDLGLTEKMPLPDDDTTIRRIAVMQSSLATAGPRGTATHLERLTVNYRRLGLARLVPYFAGGLLLELGSRLRNLADTR